MTQGEIQKKLICLHSKMLELIDYFDLFCKKYNIQYFLWAGSVLGAVRHKGFIPWDDDFDVVMTSENYYLFINMIKKEINNELFFFQEENTHDWPMLFSKLRINNTAFIEKNDYKKNIKVHQGIYIDIFCLDNVAPTKIKRKVQYCISKILIAQSLFRRGFNHFSLLKKVFIYLSALLLPFQRSFFVFVKKFNGTKSTLYSTFFTISRWHNVFIEEEMLGSGVLLNFENMLLPVPEKYHEYLQMTYGDYMRFPSESERYKSIHAVIIDVNNSYEKYL